MSKLSLRIVTSCYFLFFGLIISGCQEYPMEATAQYGLLYATLQQFNTREQQFLNQLDSCLNELPKDGFQKSHETLMATLKLQYENNQHDLFLDLKSLDTMKVEKILIPIKTNLKTYMSGYAILSKEYYPIDLKMLEEGPSSLSSLERSMLKAAVQKQNQAADLYRQLLIDFQMAANALGIESVSFQSK